MAKNSDFNNTDNMKSYRERRRGGRDRTAAPFDSDKLNKKSFFDGNVRNDDANELEKDKNLTRADTKKSTDHNLRQEKGAELQQEAGADLTSKNRLQDKPGIGDVVGSLPTYGNGIKNQKKYRKHAAKVKEYAQPYQSTLLDEPTPPKKSDTVSIEENMADESGILGYAEKEHTETKTDVDRKANEGKLSDKTSKLEHSDKTSKLEQSDTPSKPERLNKTSKLGQKPATPTLKESADNPKLQDEPKKRLHNEGSRWSKVKEDNAEVVNKT